MVAVTVGTTTVNRKRRLTRLTLCQTPFLFRVGLIAVSFLSAVSNVYSRIIKSRYKIVTQCAADRKVSHNWRCALDKSATLCHRQGTRGTQQTCGGPGDYSDTYKSTLREAALLHLLDNACVTFPQFAPGFVHSTSVLYPRSPPRRLPRSSAC